MAETNFQKQAEEFTEAVKQFSHNKLQSEEDLMRIVEVIFREDDKDLLEKLAFSAKYAHGLMKIFQDRSNDFEEEYFQKIKGEYSEAIKDIREKLSVVIGNSTSFIKSIFEEKYLAMTQDSMMNLKKLIEDLSWVKMYLNDQKRRD